MSAAATTTASSSQSPIATAVLVGTFAAVSWLVTLWERLQRQRHGPHDTFVAPKVSYSHPSSTQLVAYLHGRFGKRWRYYYTLQDEVFVRTCPKVELHVHLDGSLDPDVLWQLLQTHGKELLTCLPVSTKLPWDAQNPLPVRSLVANCQTAKEFHTLCTCRRGQRSLQEMLQCFEIFLPLVKGAASRRHLGLDVIEHLAYDFCQRQWEQHVVYTEVRYCPHLLMMEELPHRRESEQSQQSSSSTTEKDNQRHRSSTTADDDNDNDEEEVPMGAFDMSQRPPVDLDHSMPQQVQDERQLEQHRLESARQVLLAVTRGLRRGCRDFEGIVVNQILCAITWRPDWANDIVTLAHQHRNHYPCAVVGVDIAAGEEHFINDHNRHNYPMDLHQPHYDMMQRAQALKIPITIHAGEIPTLDGIGHVQRAIRKGPGGYGAQRIGHGYNMIGSVPLMQQLQREQIHVELCPTSSVETGGWAAAATTMDDSSSASANQSMRRSSRQSRLEWKEHPGLTMMQHGISVSINSDDPAVFHTSLAWQYRIALAKMGLTKDQLIQTNLDAIGAAFCRDYEKERVRKILLDFHQQQGHANSAEGNGGNSEDDCRFTDRVRDPLEYLS